MENQLLFTLSCCENRENGASSEPERIAPSPPWRENRSLLCRELRYFFRRKKASASRHFLSIAGKLPERRPVLSRRGGKTAPCSVENSGTFSVGKRQVLHATPFPLPENCRREDRYFPAVAGKPLLALQRTPVLFPLGKRQVLHATPFPLPESCRREDRYFPAVAGKPLLAPQRTPVLFPLGKRQVLRT